MFRHVRASVRESAQGPDLESLSLSLSLYYISALARPSADARTDRSFPPYQAVPVVKKHTEDAFKVTFTSHGIYRVADVGLHGTPLPILLVSTQTQTR